MSKKAGLKVSPMRDLFRQGHALDRQTQEAFSEKQRELERLFQTATRQPAPK